MQKDAILPKLDTNQRKMMASIASDLGKVVFAAGVVGYFIPSIETKVTVEQFALGFLISLLFFEAAVKLAKEET